jgi:hypothetical protein
MSLRHLLRRRMAVAISLVLLTGCAMASAPLTPITSITPLVGKWSGTVDQGGQREFFYLTINADQTFVASWGINWCNGRITIANGRARYQMTPPPLEGTMTLFEGGARPSLQMQDTWEPFRANVAKQ